MIGKSQKSEVACVGGKIKWSTAAAANEKKTNVQLTWSAQSGNDM